MTTKSLPAHGTYARGNGAPGYREPCPCEPCYRAMRRGRKKYVVNRQLGRPGLIDATPARERLRHLQQTMTWEQISAAIGSDPGNLQHIADGSRTQIRRSTLARVLAIEPVAPAPGKYLDVTGTRRRIQALRTLGYSAKAIAERAGSAEARIQLISSGKQPTIRQVLAIKIRNVYAELHQTPAPDGRSATRTKNHALASGWAPPGAWDDDTIDDPQAQPDYGRELNFHERAALRREEIIHFAWHGETPDQILARLNGEVSISTVRQIVQDWRTGEKRQRKQVAA